MREVREETALDDRAGRARRPSRGRSCATPTARVERHFVILCFAARWIAGEPVLNEELAEARWLEPAELAGLKTTEGLAEIVAAAFERMTAGNA